MNEEGARPTADRMTSPPSSCYYASCAKEPMWGIGSSVKQKNPDGSALTLYTCDAHYADLTGELRGAGTKYTLFPINGPHLVSPEEPRAQVLSDPNPPSDLPGMFRPPESKLGKFLFGSACVATGLIVGLFLILYYGGRWILGWRPPTEEA